MPKRRGRKAVERSQYSQYMTVAEHFYKAAEDSMELEYWTAASVPLVHSAIAFADALCIKLSGQRSSGENHEETITILEGVVASNEETTKALGQLRRLIEEKTKVSYMGELYTPASAKEMWKRLVRFREWAVRILMR